MKKINLTILDSCGHVRTVQVQCEYISYQVGTDTTVHDNSGSYSGTLIRIELDMSSRIPETMPA